MLQNMSQPNPQELDDNDEYALPVGTERLPDIVSEMNEERGIKTVVNYNADIPEEMKLQTEKPRQETCRRKMTKMMGVMRLLSMMPVNLMKRTIQTKNRTTYIQKKVKSHQRVNYEHRHME